MKRDPLRLVKEGNVIKRGKGDMISKEDELRLIQSIEIQKHQSSASGCGSTLSRARQAPLEIPILRIWMSDHLSSGPTFTGCLEYVVCPRLKGLSAKKLVVITNGADPKLSLVRANVGMFDEHVVDLRACVLDNLGPNLHLEIEARRLVVIFSLCDKSCRSEGYPTRNDWVLEWSTRISAQIASYSRLRHSACDIVLVNFSDLDYPANPKRSFEALCKASFDDFDYDDWSLSETEHWRPASEVANVKFKFITLKEYVTDYDWNGVLTEERAAEILQQAEE